MVKTASHARYETAEAFLWRAFGKTVLISISLGQEIVQNGLLTGNCALRANLYVCMYVCLFVCIFVCIYIANADKMMSPSALRGWNGGSGPRGKDRTLLKIKRKVLSVLN